MIIGFTGTRRGMTKAQRSTLGVILFDQHESREFHHGDCIGADEEAHGLARAFGFRIVLHPPSDPRKRAYCEADTTRTPAEYLARNRCIVDECGLLVATPKQYADEVRSGTWSTVRYAQRIGRDVIVILPDGRTVDALMRELCLLDFSPPGATRIGNSGGPGSRRAPPRG